MTKDFHYYLRQRLLFHTWWTSVEVAFIMQTSYSGLKKLISGDLPYHKNTLRRRVFNTQEFKSIIEHTITDQVHLQMDKAQYYALNSIDRLSFKSRTRRLFIAAYPSIPPSWVASSVSNACSKYSPKINP